MFAKLKEFRVRLGGLGRCSGAAQTPCNDNRRDRGSGAALPHNKRPVLVCHWRRTAPTGGLACFWHTQAADPSASEEPAIGSPFDPSQRLFGMAIGVLQPGRLQTPVVRIAKYIKDYMM